MPTQWPPLDYVFVEPRGAMSYPRRFALHWAVANLPADNPGHIGVYLGEISPWKDHPTWVEIRQLKIGMQHNNLAGTLDVTPDFTFGQTIIATGVSGYVVLEPKVITGMNGPDAVEWPDVNIITTGEVFTGPIGQQSPLMYITFENNLANDNVWIYLDGLFYERPDIDTPTPVDVKKFLRWG